MAHSPFLIFYSGKVELGFHYYLNIERKALTLSYFSINKDERRQGKGRKLMEMICAAADKNDLDIVLEINTSFGESEEFLREFYKKFGFISTEGMEMIRLSVK